MASITLPIPLPVDAATAWAAVRDVGQVRLTVGQFSRMTYLPPR